MADAADYRRTDYYNIKNTSGNSRDGEYYHSESGHDSHGNPGTWHIYPDGTKEFIAASPPTAGSTGGTPAPVAAAPAPAPAAAPAPAPAPSSPPPSNNTGGTPAPQSPPPNSGSYNWDGRPGWDHPMGSAPSTGPANAQGNPQDSGSTRTWGGQSTLEHPMSSAPVSAPAPSTGGTPAPVSSAAPAPSVVSSSPQPMSSSSAHQSPVDITGGTTTPADGGATHTVVHGDTMWSIAKANNLSLKQLEDLNPKIKNPDLIFPGQRINLGGGAASPPADTSGGNTVVATPTSAVFPKTSSYPSAKQVEAAVKTELSGWAGGTGNVASDPARGVIEAVEKPNTDPLKIKNDKPHTA